MKLKALKQYIDFVEAVQSCEGEVIFCSAEGDRLNLKSTLSQFVFAAACGEREFLTAGHVECADPEDYNRLEEFLEAE